MGDLVVLSSDFENSLNVFIRQKSPDVSKGIVFGMKIEEMGIKFYDKNAEKSDAEVRHIFRFLAGQEREHLRLLKNLKYSILKNGKWAEPSRMKTFGQIPKIFKESKKYDFEMSAILEALEAEKLSKKFYENLGNKIKNSHGKKFFRKMAEFESRHIALLNGILDIGGFRMQS